MDGLMFPKESASRDPKYLKWVREQPSCISGAIGCVAHHIVGHGRTGTVKTSDYWAIPLTDAEHKDLHNHGYKTWESVHMPQHWYALRTLTRAIAEGFFNVE